MDPVRTPSILTNPSDYSTFLAQSVRIQMADEIPILMEDVTKFTSLFMKVDNRKPVPNPIWYHMEDELVPYLMRFKGADESSAGTTFTLSQWDNGNLMREGMMGFVPRTKERFRITTDPTTTCTVSRNIQGSAGLLRNGDIVIVMAPADETGGTTPVSRHIEPVLKTFRMQNAREAMRITDVAATASVYGLPRRLRDQKKLMLKHKLGWELSLLFAYSTSATYGTDTWPTYHTQGLLNHIQSNVFSIPFLTLADLEAAIEPMAFYHKSGAGFLAVCGSMAIRAINGWGSSLMQTTPAANQTFGYTTSSVRTSFGMLELDYHPLLTGPYLEGLMIIIPKPVTDFIQYRPLVGNGMNHSTRLYTNQQQNGSETLIDEVKTKAGFEFWEEVKFGLIEGIAG